MLFFMINQTTGDLPLSSPPEVPNINLINGQCVTMDCFCEDAERLEHGFNLQMQLYVLILYKCVTHGIHDPHILALNALY